MLWHLIASSHDHDYYVSHCNGYSSIPFSVAPNTSDHFMKYPFRFSHLSIWSSHFASPGISQFTLVIPFNRFDQEVEIYSWYLNSCGYRKISYFIEHYCSTKVRLQSWTCLHFFIQSVALVAIKSQRISIEL